MNARQMEHDIIEALDNGVLPTAVESVVVSAKEATITIVYRNVSSAMAFIYSAHVSETLDDIFPKTYKLIAIDMHIGEDERTNELGTPYVRIEWVVAFGIGIEGSFN